MPLSTDGTAIVHDVPCKSLSNQEDCLILSGIFALMVQWFAAVFVQFSIFRYSLFSIYFVFRD
jgi:hypothetical protein